MNSNTVSTLLLTPPFVQLSSPYSATPFLKGYLQTKGIFSHQIDLSILTFLRIFSKDGFERMFESVEHSIEEKSDYQKDFLLKKELYCSTIDSVIAFLQGKYPQLARKIATRTYLPEDKRFDTVKKPGLKHTNTIEYSLHCASLYIDDVVDFLKDTIVPDFNLSSYKSNAASSGIEFGSLQKELSENNVLTETMISILDDIDFSSYTVCGITVPFPGNLFCTLKICEYLKRKYRHIKIVIGGGYVNTDLRFLKDTGIFQYVDFITLDDGEEPIEKIIRYVSGEIQKESLVRTFFVDDEKLHYTDNSEQSVKYCATPDYSGLDLTSYITLRESVNAMHSLWSEKNYLKMRMAHGCYHHGCSFCDTSLDYIAHFHPEKAEEIIAQMEKIIAETGIRAFHFVDEAMPPALLREFCTIIIRKKLDVTWWGNIRFDKKFSSGLCQLMSKAGCIAVSGGIESANNTILKRMNKNATVENYAYVCNNFSQAKILVHGYLIYGFPGETINDCIESLEIVRQFFSLGILNSAFYHRFSLTIHSPVYKNPDDFGITIPQVALSSFSNNDVQYHEKKQSHIDQCGEGLNKAIYNFNYLNALDLPLAEWFPGIKFKHTIEPDFVKKCIKKSAGEKLTAIPVWTGTGLSLQKFSDDESFLTFSGTGDALSYQLPIDLATSFFNMLVSVDIAYVDINTGVTLSDWLKNLFDRFFTSSDDLFRNELWHDLRKCGLILL